MPRLSHPARMLAIIVLAVCAATAGSAVRGQTTAQGDFLRTAMTAIAHGKRADAERLATARGAGDPQATVVLARLAVHRGEYTDALALLEPAAAREPGGEAALELALLYVSIGRAADATPLFNAVSRTAGSSSDPAVLLRAARAARALNRPREANGFFRDAERAGADPAIVETAW